MNKKKISLCLVVFNEIKGCKKDLPLIRKNDFNEIFAIDGGSKDGTIKYLKSKGIKVFQQTGPGLNNAYISGVNRAKYENIIFFFPKGSLNPKILNKFIFYFNQNYEFIVASRMMPKGSNEEDNKIFKFRKWSVIILSSLVSFLWRKESSKIGDILHGVKGIKKNHFKKMKINNFGFTIDLETAIQAYKLNLRIKEFAVKEKIIINRISNFPFWRTGFFLILFLLKEFRFFIKSKS